MVFKVSILFQAHMFERKRRLLKLYIMKKKTYLNNCINERKYNFFPNCVTCKGLKLWYAV